MEWIKNLFSGGGLEKEEIARLIKDISEEDAIRDYELLKQMDLTTVSNAITGNKFVDYFTFVQRLETISKKGMSYFEFAEDTEYQNRPYIQNLMKYHKGEERYAALYKVFTLHCGTIGLFKPISAMEIYNRFKPTTVLDFTMGWGGRLVGACALDVPNYIGIDSNMTLKEPYQKMTKLLKKLGTTTKIKLMFKDALKVDYSKLNYDFVFTSPPYYNIELYEGTTKKTDEDWDNTFYIPIFTKTYQHLKKGGYYVLNISSKLYETVCMELFGPATMLIPFKIKPRQKHHKTDKDYNEYLYVWKK
jgi:hypothetical protein